MKCHEESIVYFRNASLNIRNRPAVNYGGFYFTGSGYRCVFSNEYDNTQRQCKSGKSRPSGIGYQLEKNQWAGGNHYFAFQQNDNDRHGAGIRRLCMTDKKNSASKTLNIKVISGLLPVGLSYFHIAKNANGVLVSWCTQMESNNSRFVIQKSVDGVVFTDVASVDSEAKNGNSNTVLNYSYQISGKMADADAGSGFLIMMLLSFILMISKSRRIYKSLLLIIFCLSLFSCSKSMMTPDSSVTVPSKTFYRLKLVNLDGQFTYSGIVINR